MQLDENMKQIIRDLAGKKAKADLGPVDEQELRDHYQSVNEMKVGQTPVKTSSYDFPEEEAEPTLEEIQARIDSMDAPSREIAGEAPNMDSIGEVPEMDENEMKKLALAKLMNRE